MKRRRIIIVVVLVLLETAASLSVCIAFSEGHLSLSIWSFILGVLIWIPLKYAVEGGSLYLPHEIKRDRERVAEYKEKMRILNEEKRAKMENIEIQMENLLEKYKGLPKEIISKNLFSLDRVRKLGVELANTYPSNTYTFDRILIFESNSNMLISNRHFRFSDIISYELRDKDEIIYQSINTTSNANIFPGEIIPRINGRIIDRTLIGNTTDKAIIDTNSQVITVKHDYTIQVVVNSISEPQFTLSLFEDQDMANEIAVILSVIIERNKIQNERTRA